MGRQISTFKKNQRATEREGEGFSFLELLFFHPGKSGASCGCKACLPPWRAIAEEPNWRFMMCSECSDKLLLPAGLAFGSY